MSNSSALISNQSYVTTAASVTTALASSACYSFEASNYIGSALGIFGIITNIMNIIVFAQAPMRKNPMNVYLLAKSASDLYFLIQISLEPLTYCASCTVNYTFAYKVFQWIYRGYLSSASQVSSILLEVMATFDRYVTISGNFKLYKRIKYWIFILVIYAYCLIYYSSLFFMFVIKKYTGPDNRSIYFFDYTDFGLKVAYTVLRLTHTIQRDCVSIILIIILNVLIMIHIRRAMKKKKAIGSAHSNPASASTSRADRAELKITLMVVLTGITAVIAHFLEFIYFLPIPQIQLSPTSTCFYVISAFIYVLAVGINFFYYYFFNHIYQETFLGLIYRVLANFGVKQRAFTSVLETESSKTGKKGQTASAQFQTRSNAN